MGHIVDHTSCTVPRNTSWTAARWRRTRAAMDLLGHFGLTIHAGAEVQYSAAHQTALLTLVNVARRTLLAGVEIIGLADGAPCISAACARSLVGR